MSQVVHFNGVALEVLEHNHSRALSNRQVAEGFGVSEEAIRQQESRGEYKEGIHFFLERVKHDGMGGVAICNGGVTNCHGGAQDMTFWTKKGVITLGFKLRETPQTVAFRDWVSDFIINPSHTTPAPFSLEITLLQSKLAETITALSQKSRQVDEFRQKYYATLERENELLRAQALKAHPKAVNPCRFLSKEEKENIVEALSSRDQQSTHSA